MEKTKYDLELEFKALALEAYNRNNPAPVEASSIAFQSYIDGIVWSMIERKEIQSWIEYYERKATE